MIGVEENSVFSVKGGFALSSVDERVLLECYLPLIGPNAYTVYHILLDIASGKTEGYSSAVDVAEISGLTMSGIATLMTQLEGIGLVSAYRKEDQNKASYIYKLFCPMPADAFFHNPMLTSLLISKVGERRVKDIQLSFAQESEVPSGYTDITAKFSDVFDISPDFNSINRLSGQELIKEAQKYQEPSYEFSLEDFASHLRALSIDPDALKDKEAEIGRICGVYGVNPQTAADLVKSSLNSYNDFNYSAFQKDIRNYHHFNVSNLSDKEDSSEEFGTSDYARRLHEYQTKSPLVFLQYLLHAELPESYKLLLDKLSSVYKAPNPVINVVLDYTVQRCNGAVPEEFAVKTLISVLHAKITTAADAMSFLYQNRLDAIAKTNKKRTYPAKDKDNSAPSENKDSKEKVKKIDIADILGEDI